MIEISEKQFEFARAFWFQYYRHKEMDKKIEAFLNLDSSEGWLSKARTALLLSTGEMAERLEIERSTYARLEKSEEQNSITLAKLKQAAEAMDCELVYAIRPKSRALFSEIIWQKLLTPSLSVLSKRPHPPHMRGQVLGSIAKNSMQDTNFRRKQKWSARKH